MTRVAGHVCVAVFMSPPRVPARHTTVTNLSSWGLGQGTCHRDVILVAILDTKWAFVLAGDRDTPL